MGSIPLGANNFFSPKKCACHLCDKVLTFYYVLQKFSWLLASTHTIMNNSMSAQTVTLWNVWQNVPPRPGIEPGPSTWQAEILTTRLSRNRYQSPRVRQDRKWLSTWESTKKKNPSSRIWTSDLWMSDNYNYSPPLYQLSYRGLCTVAGDKSRSNANVSSPRMTLSSGRLTPNLSPQLTVLGT